MRQTARTVLIGSLLALGLALPLTIANAQQAVTLKIDPKSSLAWWQINPHMEHLWGTTCPQDPSWRPGEGRSLAWASDFLSRGAKTGHSTQLLDSADIPLYPRRRVRAVCTEAVTGEVTVDTVGWTKATGNVTVEAKALTTGSDMRDNYAHKTVYVDATYPYLKMQIDSIGRVEVAKSARGDTVKTLVYGTFEMRGVKHPAVALAKTTHEAAGLRVKASFKMPAKDMTEVYGMSKMALGLGVGQTLWQELWVGIDLLLKN